MKLETALTFQSRLLFRISHEPTQSARALRAVIRLHAPEEDAYTAGHVGHLREDADYCAAWPCETLKTIALELGVPLPEEPAYGALVDG